MFTGEWFFLDGTASDKEHVVKFDTNTMDEAIRLAVAKYCLTQHSQSSYFAILQDKDRRLVVSKSN